MCADTPQWAVAAQGTAAISCCGETEGIPAAWTHLFKFANKLEAPLVVCLLFSFDGARRLLVRTLHNQHFLHFFAHSKLQMCGGVSGARTLKSVQKARESATARVGARRACSFSNCDEMANVANVSVVRTALLTPLNPSFFSEFGNKTFALLAAGDGCRWG